MKRLFAIALVVPLVFAAHAEAKGIKWVDVCGPADCNRTLGRDLDFSKSPLIFPPYVMSGKPDKPPAHKGKWLKVRVKAAHSKELMRSVVMPTKGYAGGNQGGGYGFVWERLSNAAQGTYLDLGRGLERYPAKTVPGLRADRPAALTIGSVFNDAARNAAGLTV